MADPEPPTDEPAGDAAPPRVRPAGRHRRLDNRTIAICVCVALVAALAAGLVATFVSDRSSSSVAVSSDSGPVGKLSLTPLDRNAPTTLPNDPIEGLVGDPFRFADLTGTPLVVNFFSTSCAPCVKEMPGLEQVHQQLGDQVTFVGIDVTDTKAAGRGLVQRTGVTYRTGYDPQGNVLRDVNGQVLPTTLVVDRTGKVLDARTRALTPDQLMTLLIDHQLVSGASPPVPDPASTTAPGPAPAATPTSAP